MDENQLKLEIENIQKKIELAKEKLQNNPNEQSWQQLFESASKELCYLKKKEMESKNIASNTRNTADTMRQFFCDESLSIQGYSTKSLADLNAPVGPTTETCIPDIVCAVEIDSRLFGLAVVQFHDICYSPLEQIGPAYAFGCNIILSHYHAGVETANCAVPLAITNGNLYQFGWVSLLEPSFPVLHITSGVLDGSFRSTEIAENLTRMKMFCQQSAQKIAKAIRSGKSRTFDSTIALDLGKYHRKKMENVFCRFGNSESEKSLHYQWKVYEALKDVIEVVKPLTFARLCADNLDSQELIFPMMKGFRIGVPNRAKEFDWYLEKLTIAVKKIHSCGIVHVDLYPSNILWKNDNGCMVIRIVDWDVATFIDEDFTPQILERLKDPEIAPFYYSKTDRAQTRCDYWFLYIFSRLSDVEKQTMRGDIETVNDVYRSSVIRQLKEAGGTEGLLDQFETWFSSQ